MPSNTAGLDALISGLDDLLREAMDILAEEGESYAKHVYTWQDDTGSLAASITGYEALTGDPYKNYGDATWVGAQTGAIRSRYGTPPANYIPHPSNVNLGEADHPVAVVSTMVDYGLGVSFSLVNDIRDDVIATLEDALNMMTQGVVWAIQMADTQGLLK